MKGNSLVENSMEPMAITNVKIIHTAAVLNKVKKMVMGHS